MAHWFLFSSLCAFATVGFGQKAPAHRIVVEVNVPGKQAYEIVLGNIANLRKALAPDPVEIEVVCEGRGVDMLLQSGPVTKRILSAEKQGVKFAACKNTLKFRRIDPKHLIKGVSIVPAGVAEVVKKQEQGWSYLKGAF